MEEEIWREVKDYERLYEVSNLGRLKSLKWEKERILKPGKDTNGYLIVDLSKDSIRKNKTVHQLVAIAFLNHTPCGHKIVVDHIDNNPSNNRLDNLQLVTTRENVSKDRKNKKKFTGVYKSGKKFTSQIRFDGRVRSLGSFDTPEEASEYYQNALTAISNGTEIVSVKRIKLSKYKGVSFNKGARKWVAFYNRKHIGVFKTEEEAYERLQLEINNSDQ